MDKTQLISRNLAYRERVGTPLTVSVKRIATDVDGKVISKSTLPQNLQVDYPVFMFNNYDFNSKFKIGQQVQPEKGAAIFFKTFIGGSADFLFFTGLNTIQEEYDFGDLVTVYTDDVKNPNYFIFIILSCNLQPYGGIIQAADGFYKLDEFIYKSDNLDNYNEVITLVQLSRLGKWQEDQISPLSARQIFNEQDDIITIKLRNIFLVQRFGMYTYIRFDSDLLTFSFTVYQNSNN